MNQAVVDMTDKIVVDKDALDRLHRCIETCQVTWGHALNVDYEFSRDLWFYFFVFSWFALAYSAVAGAQDSSITQSLCHLSVFTTFTVICTWALAYVLTLAIYYIF